MFEEFFANNAVKAITIAVLIVLLVAVGLVYLVITYKLRGEQRKKFKKLSYKIYGQLLCICSPPVILLIVGVRDQDFSFVVGDALPAMAFFAALPTLWDSWTTHKDLNEAKQKIDSRPCLQTLTKINGAVSVFALFTLVAAGAILAILYFKLLEPAPSWLWFLSFMITAPAIFCMAISQILGYCVAQLSR